MDIKLKGNLTDDQKRIATNAALGGALALGATSSFAALDTSDTSAIKQGFDANQTSGENVGTFVVLFVLGMLVFGVVLKLMNKI